MSSCAKPPCGEMREFLSYSLYNMKYTYFIINNINYLHTILLNELEVEVMILSQMCLNHKPRYIMCVFTFFCIFKFELKYNA